MAENRKMSDTGELESILAEARSRNRQASAQSPSRPAAKRAAAPRPAAVQSAPDDSFVMVDENGRISSAAPAEEDYAPAKRSKKPLIVAIVVILAVLLAASAGVTWYMMSGTKEGFADNISISGVQVAGMSTNQAKAALADVESKLAEKIAYEVIVGETKINLTKDDFEYSFNTDDILREAKEYSEKRGIKTGTVTYEIKMTVDSGNCPEIAKRIAGQVDKEPEDAKVVSFNSEKSDMFTYSDGAEGLKLKQEELSSTLSSMISAGKFSGSIEAPYDTPDPEITADYLRSKIVKLSSFTTTSTNSWNGNENMRVSLAACNNSIIEPGDTWSFNNCTGNSNLESNGYKPAGVLVQGRSEIGIGGGICQSSTTIYNAGIIAGLDVVERYCHYYPSSYVEIGRDATIDYGNLDLKLKNPFDTQVFLKCYMDGVVLHAEIYGIQSPEFDDVKISTYSNGYNKYGATRTFYLNGSKVRSDELPSSEYYTASAANGGTNTSSSTESGSASPTTGSDSGEPYSDPDVPVDPDPVVPDVPVDSDPVVPDDPEPIVSDGGSGGSQE